MKKRLLVLWSVLGLLIPYFLPASIVVAEEIETSRGIYFLSEPTEQVDFSTEKEQLSEIFQEKDWVFLNPINIRFYVEGQLDYQKYFPVFKDGDFHQLIDESNWQLAPSEVAGFIQNHSKTTKPTSPMTFIIVNYAWYGFFDETWYDLYLNEPADLSELLSDLEETIIIRDLFTDYQDQVKQEQSNQKALESSQQSTSSREETNHDFSTSTESQENKQSEESKENVEGISEDEPEGAIRKNTIEKLEVIEDYKSENKKVLLENYHGDWGDFDYTNGLIDSTNSNGFAFVNRIGEYTFNRKDFYFLIKEKDGKYAYAQSIYTNSFPHSSNLQLKRLGMDGVHYRMLGGNSGSGNQVNSHRTIRLIGFQFIPEFYRFYDVNSNDDPNKNQNIHVFLNWLNFWTDNEVTVIQKDTLLSMENYIREKNSGVKYEPLGIDYTNGLIEIDGSNEGIFVTNRGFYGLGSNLYFLIKSKDGKYAYTRNIYTNSYQHNSIRLNKRGTDAVHYRFSGGDHGTSLNINSSKTPIIVGFEFKPDFYRFYDVSSDEDPYKNQNIHVFLNWLNFWTENEITVIQKDNTLSMDNYVRGKNSGVKYEPLGIDYTNGLIEREDSDEGTFVSNGAFYGLGSNLYFLIKSKNGKYAYTQQIYTNSYQHNSIRLSKQGTDGVHYRFSGGDHGTALNINSSIAPPVIVGFEFRSEFYLFYDVTKNEDPYKNKNIHVFLNWLNFWTDNEITIVQTDAVDLYVAQKNNDIQPWRFFKTGRQSIRDQTFSLTLDETTRLDFDMRGRSGQRLTVYQENETKVFGRKYSGFNNTVTLDLPAGSYYIAMTDITAETTLQIRRHQFNDFQLSIDTNPERTHIYLNGVFHQELTDIYAPHHRPLQLPTAVSVSNKLNSIWRTSRGSHPVLDAMFGKNYLLGTNLREQTFPTVGNLPLGSTSLSAPLQYVGNGQFYTDAQIVNFGPQQRFVITGSTLLLAMAGTLVVYYAAHLIHTNQLQLTTPSIFREFETGSWEELEKFTYHGIVSYEGKTYGVNDETGEIKNTETGEELPKSVIPDDIRKSAAGASKLAINKILADLKRVGIDNIEDEYEWYTFKDLVQDELEGYGNKRGHTIEKHVMKSDAYLKNRLNTDNLLFSSTYYGVVEALIAINVTKLKHPEVFQNVGKQEGQFVKTPFELGKGYNSKNVLWSPLRNNQLYLMPSSSEKGFRVLTSYPVYKMGD